MLLTKPLRCIRRRRRHRQVRFTDCITAERTLLAALLTALLPLVLLLPGDVTTVTKLAWEVIELAPGEMAELPDDSEDRDLVLTLSS